MNSVRRRRRIIKKKRKTLGRSNSDPKLLGHRSTADPVILFEGWGRWSNKERVLSPESLFNFDFGLFSDAKKRIGSRNAWSNGKRKRERKKRKKSRHWFYYREEERERERGESTRAKSDEFLSSFNESIIFGSRRDSRASENMKIYTKKRDTYFFHEYMLSYLIRKNFLFRQGFSIPFAWKV